MGQRLQSSQFGQAVGQRFQDSVPVEVQSVVQDLDRLETVCEWAKTQATQRGMFTLARACDDIQDIAHVQKKLIIRQSPFAQPLGNATRQVIQNAVQQLQQYTSQPEVQDALSAAQQTTNAISQALTRLQSVGGSIQSTGQIQPGGTQQGGFQSTGQFQSTLGQYQPIGSFGPQQGMGP